MQIHAYREIEWKACEPNVRETESTTVINIVIIDYYYQVSMNLYS